MSLTFAETRPIADDWLRRSRSGQDRASPISSCSFSPHVSLSLSLFLSMNHEKGADDDRKTCFECKLFHMAPDIPREILERVIDYIGVKTYEIERSQPRYSILVYVAYTRYTWDQNKLRCYIYTYVLHFGARSGCTFGDNRPRCLTYTRNINIWDFYFSGSLWLVLCFNGVSRMCRYYPRV